MKHYKIWFQFLFIIFCGTSCTTTSRLQPDHLKYAVINCVLEHYKPYSIYLTTVKPDFSHLPSERIQEIDVNLLLQFNISSNNQNLKFENVFTLQEIEEINRGFKEVKIQKLERKYINESHRITSNKKARRITTPVVLENKKYAFVYSEGPSDGELICVELLNGKWDPLFVSPIWNTD